VRVSLIAALSGKGTSTIQNEQIDRGYERIDERLLRAIGAKIVRVE
jgi:UDP-N-acetylglucosamine enolpyruvyl transferase